MQENSLLCSAVNFILSVVGKKQYEYGKHGSSKDIAVGKFFTAHIRSLF